MVLNQVPDKRSIGIPEDFVSIRQEIKDLRDEAAALVGQAIAIVYEAEQAEAQRKQNEDMRQRAELARQETEAKRQMAEIDRKYEFERMKARLLEFERMLGAYQRAIDALGSLHDEHDYMVLRSALHTRNGVGEYTDGGFKFMHGTTDGKGGLAIAGEFFGLEDKWQN